MEANNVNQLLITIGDKLNAYQLNVLKNKLETADDSEMQNYILAASCMKDPMTALLLDIFLCGGRAYIGEVWKTVLMWVLILCCGIGIIWWFIDLFQISDATREYNMKQLNMMLANTKGDLVL